jgi:hypothetical protein
MIGACCRKYYGYLAGYRIEVTSDGRDYKIVADHG